MTKTILTLAIASLSLVACKKDEKKEDSQSTVDSTATKTEEVATVMPDSAAISKAFTEYATVGEAHKMMAMEDGKWTGDMTMWMFANDPKPMKSTTTAEYKMVLGGRYQEGVYKGNFMGMPFEGRGTLAYDNASQEYISTWIDNMGTGVMIMKGKYDPATKMLSFEGDIVDPVTKKTKKMRETITIVDDNTRKMEMYDTGYDGKEYKNMEIISTRKK